MSITLVNMIKQHSAQKEMHHEIQVNQMQFIHAHKLYYQKQSVIFLFMSKFC